MSSQGHVLLGMQGQDLILAGWQWGMWQLVAVGQVIIAIANNFFPPSAAALTFTEAIHQFLRFLPIPHSRDALGMEAKRQREGKGSTILAVSLSHQQNVSIIMTWFQTIYNLELKPNFTKKQELNADRRQWRGLLLLFLKLSQLSHSFSNKYFIQQIINKHRECPSHCFRQWRGTVVNKTDTDLVFMELTF